MKRYRIAPWCAALVLLCTAMSDRAYSQSLNEQLVGNWKFVFWNRVVDGKPEPGPFGPAPIGHHIFTTDGYFCVAVMPPDRPTFPAADYRAGSLQEKASAFDTFVSYCGRYEANEQERSLLLRPDVSWFPNWTGASLKRFVEVTGDRVTFKFRLPGIEGKTVESVFVWQRVK